ncbi:hypothetical protein GRI39_11755 [Altererythrobacter indicus]|uniref:Serine aminopeptidase S33 domain-containing protein n=1 Tax=Altericroceibacterium indicum TaxID=374177 RepID=A0A845A8Y7_9SPHN|nr:alpha/beta hydrolase [Altericroceibacterium indicum]MXP26710.1 hypothetical protein [Altericroceibacterium indicum]
MKMLHIMPGTGWISRFAFLSMGAAALALGTGAIAHSDPKGAHPGGQSEAGAISTHWQGTMPNGNLWELDMPASWNGTVILTSHGYHGGDDKKALHSLNDSLDLQEKLLSEGYAMLGSSYSRNGWAVEEGMADQKATLDLFTARFGKPRRVIAYGQSMGGLISLGLVEKWPEAIDGAMPVCASAAGATPMMNVALDGMFAFKTLLAPDLTLIGADNEMAERAKAQKALDAAQQTPQGRARIALSAALAQIPTWSGHDATPDQQEEALYKDLLWGAMLPRSDQEERAGGNFSSNVGVDYADLLARSGEADLVRTLYQQAGLNLEADLAAINAAPRIKANKRAVAYMDANFVPSGNLKRPVLLMHTLGDNMTPPSLTSGLAIRVKAAGNAANLRRIFVDRTGHCNFTSAELETGLDQLIARLDSGAWPDLSAQHLNQGSGRGDAAKAFSDQKPAEMTRP